MKTINRKYLSGAGLLIIALVISNLFNFIFNAFLGRIISFEDYAVITLIGNIWLILSIIITALLSTVNHETAFLAAKYGQEDTYNFFKSIQKQAIKFALIATVLWLIIIPLLSIFFNISNWSIFIFFSPIIFFGTLLGINKGFLQGNLFFLFFACITVIEPTIKLLIGIALVLVHLNSFTYLSVPISVICAFIISAYFTSKIGVKKAKEVKIEFPKQFMIAAVLNGISSTAFLTIDVLMAKHFLSDIQAGQYALLSLVGKMIFYFGSLLSTLMITAISRSEGENKNSSSYFYKFFAVSVLISICGFLILGPGGKLFVPILFGGKANDLLPYLTSYTLAITLFTISNTIIVFHLAKKQFLFPILGVILSSLLIFGIIISHNSIEQIVNVVLVVSGISFVIIFLTHYFLDNGRFIVRDILNIVDSLHPHKKILKLDNDKKRILIFNWRDIKHKYGGGAEVYIHEIAKRWVEDGNQVTLFCGNDRNSSNKEIIDGVEIIRKGGFYFVYIWALFYYLFKLRGKYDVILDCQNGIPFFTPLYAKEKVFCLIFHVHQEVFRNYLPKPLAFIAKNLERKLMPFAYRNSKYITISESSRIDMEKIGLIKDEIEIIFPGVDLSQFKTLQKDKEPMVLYLGRLKSYKSIDVLIKAFAIIHKNNSNAKLIIAGEGDEELNLKKLAKDLSINEFVQFTGRVSNDEKIDLMQRTWVFVNPSFMEGWGITTIEANACGAPVVASDVAGLRDSVKTPQAGYLVPHGKHIAFAKRINEILNNNDLRNNMSNEAHLWAQNFDWEKSALKFISLF